MVEIPLGYVEAWPLQVEALYAATYPGHSFYDSDRVAKLIEVRYRKSRNR